MKILLLIHNYFDLLVKTTGSFVKIVILSKLSEIGSFKITRNKNELLILANGPSLIRTLNNIHDISRNRDVMVVNYFAENELYEKIKPNLYCISAPELFIDNPIEEVLNKSNKLFHNIADKTKWKLNLFLVSSAKNSKRLQKAILKNKNISIYYFNTTPVEGFRNINYFCWRFNIGMPRPHNVLIPSIIIGINLGYKKVLLLGADHSWLKEISVDDDNIALINQKHFYDINTSKHRPMMKGFNGENRKLYEILHKFYLTFKGYHEINKYALKYSCHIYNATPNSYIDAFERKKLIK